MSDTERAADVADAADSADGTDSADATEAASADAREPPRLEGWPLVDSTVAFARDPFGFYDRLESRGDAVRYGVAGGEFCTVFEPEYVQQILVEENHRFVKAEMFRKAAAGFAEQGLLLTEGEVWRDQRVRVQPAFTPERIQRYADAMVEYAERAADDLADGAVLDVTDAMSELTLRILAKSLLDVDVAGRRAVVREAAAALNDRGDASGASAFLPDWVPTPKNRRFKRAMAEFETMVDDLIAERRDASVAPRATENASGDEPRADGEEYDDLLALLLHSEGPDGTTMSDEVVRDQMVTFLFAGHETTSLALAYAWHLLGRNPDATATLRAELDEEVGDRCATMADLPALDYTERVVRETLRLYPPAYVLFREPTEDVQIGPYRIEEGTNLTIPAFKIHRDERFYDDPDAFRPERWTGEFEDEIPEYAYFPFGGGPRHCIGMRFATTELTLVLATMARELSFEPVYEGDPDLAMAATLRPDTPMEMRVERR